jgi:hypothetical protein
VDREDARSNVATQCLWASEMVDCAKVVALTALDVCG